MLINERIMNTLKREKKKQKDLAAYIGVSLSTLNTWLNSERKLPANHIIRICEFLNCSVEWLLLGENSGSPRTSLSLSNDAVELATIFDQLPKLDQNVLLGDASKMLKSAKQTAEIHETA